MVKVSEVVFLGSLFTSLVLGLVDRFQNLFNGGLFVQLIPLLGVILHAVFSLIQEIFLGFAGGDALTEQVTAQLHHQCIEAIDCYQTALLLLHKVQDFLVGKTGFAVAPVDTVSEGGFLKGFHQTAVTTAITYHNGGVGLEGVVQCLLPLRLKVICAIGTVERVEHQSPVDLRHDGALYIRVNEIRQRFVADYEGAMVRVQEQGILHKTVEIGCDNQVVAVIACVRIGTVAVGQHQGKGMVTQTGFTAVHNLLQIPIAFPGIKMEAQKVDIKIVFTGHGTVFCLCGLPFCDDFGKGMLKFFLPTEYFCKMLGALRVSGLSISVVGFSHQTVHPTHFQSVAAGNARFNRCTGPKDKAEVSRFSAIIYDFAEIGAG